MTRNLLVGAISALVVIGAAGCGSDTTSGDERVIRDVPMGSSQEPELTSSSTEPRPPTTTTTTVPATTTTMPIEQATNLAGLAVEDACNKAAFFEDAELARSEFRWDDEWTSAGLQRSDYLNQAVACAGQRISAIAAQREADRLAEVDAKWISSEEFGQIAIGMSYQRVVEIVGSEGELTYETTLFDSTMKIYDWNGPDYGTASITFMDGLVDSKAQYGLKPEAEHRY